MGDEKLLTLAEAAKRLGLKEATLREWWFYHKNLAFVHVGGVVRVDPADLKAFIARRRHALTDCAPYSRGATRRKARIALEGRGLRFTQAEVGYRLTLKGLLAVHLMPRYRGRVLESACNRIHGSGGRDCRDEFEVAAWGRALRTWETGHA